MAILLLVVACLALGTYFVGQAIANILLGVASERWPEVTAKIESANVKRMTSGRGAFVEFWLDLGYSYVVEGRSYSGRRVSFARSSDAATRHASRAEAERHLMHYAQGRRIEVRYWPRYPQVSAIEPGVDLGGAIT